MEGLDIPLLYKTRELLNSVYRQGWLDRGVSQDKCETVYDHSRNSAYAGLLFSEDKGLTDMLLIHDWPEHEIGDITPSQIELQKTKAQRENEAMLNILRDMPNREYLLGLWNEFSSQKTDRAKIAKEIEYLDMIPNAVKYMAMGIDTGAFFPYVKKRLTDSMLLYAFERLEKHDSSQDPHKMYFRLLSQMKELSKEYS
jgi:putative hydrolases of HD superfamily